MEHIILIHGTFARGAEWTLSGSDLDAAIRKNVVPRVEVTRFSRLSAGRSLLGPSLHFGHPLPQLLHAFFQANASRQGWSISEHLFQSIRFCREGPSLSHLLGPNVQVVDSAVALRQSEAHLPEVNDAVVAVNEFALRVECGLRR